MAALLVWWRAYTDGSFVVLGVSEPLTSLLGPLLPALSAGLTVAMALSLVDAAAGTMAGVIAAIVVVLLPDFLTLHRASLLGPPFTAITVLMVGVMLHAPRFSIAYGSLAATAAVFVSPAAAGLVLVAMVWAALVEGRCRRRGERVLLALAPVALLLVASHWLGSAWEPGLRLGWHGSLDVGLRAAGHIIAAQLAPTVTEPAVRWVAIADLTLLAIGVIVLAWRRMAASPTAPTAVGRLLPAVLLTGAGLVVGQTVCWLILPARPIPSLDEVFVLAVLGAIATVTAVAALWRRWPRWVQVVAGVIILGWVQAALRS